MFKTDDLQPSDATRRITGPERHMSVTPLDLRQARFATAMRGYDRTEVTTMLLEAADGYEHALRENDRLRQELVRLEASLAQFRELENSLKNTLMSAQKVADDMRETAAQEAARIVREAEGRADLITQRAQARTEEIERDINVLKMKRREAESGIEATITTLRNMLDLVREQSRSEREDRAASQRQLVEVPRTA